jgi:outer membrane protein TolC
MRHSHRPRRLAGRPVVVLSGLCLLSCPGPAHARHADPPARAQAEARAQVQVRARAPAEARAWAQVQDTVRLTLEAAVQRAVERSPAVRAARLEALEAFTRVDEVRAELRPQLSATASYTRELAAANPFAGTDALRMFGQGAPTEWLLWNERARLDGDPATRPIPLDEFQERQEAAFREAGVPMRGMRDNPFSVENQFMGGITFEQALWSPAAVAELRAAEAQREAVLAGVRQDALTVADSVREAYLGALLAAEQAEVLARSVARATVDAEEAARRVEQGVAAVPERLAAEVEAENLRTDLIEARTRAETTVDFVKFVLDLPLAQPVMLVESLRIDDDYGAADVALPGVVAEALQRRRDVRQARLALDAERARADAARGRRRPAVTAFVDVNVMGNVPDDRARVRTDPLRPFDVEEEQRGFLSGDFWDLGANAGVRVGWNILGGGRLRAQERLADIAVQAAALRVEQVTSRVELEVRQALRELQAAAARARIQEANVERAERSYTMTAERVEQGVAASLERREASTQLDRSRLALAQARHDYLAARSRLRAVTGVGLEDALLDAWLR